METAVPFDILAHITDIVDQSDKGTLRALSLTCKFMVPLCRRRIFSFVRLSNIPKEREKGLINFLSGSLDTTCRIKRLLCVIDPKLRICEQLIDVLEIMRTRSTSLRSITITSTEGLDWNLLREPIKPLLISLIQLPTVYHLNLGPMKNFPLAALSLCSGLTNFAISEFSEPAPHADQVIMHSNIPAIVSLYARGFYSAISALMRPPSPRGPIIDFSRLEVVSFEISEEIEALQMAEFLKTLKQLRKLYIEYYRDPFQFVGLGSSIAAGVYRTLRSVKLNFSVVGAHRDPLCGLPLMLRQLSQNNVLEKLRVSVLVETDEPCRTDSDDWPDFDAILTAQGAFPMLRQVSVDLIWTSYNRTEQEIEELLGNLTEDHFPRLLESPTISFQFIEEHFT